MQEKAQSKIINNRINTNAQSTLTPPSKFNIFHQNSFNRYVTTVIALIITTMAIVLSSVPAIGSIFDAFFQALAQQPKFDDVRVSMQMQMFFPIIFSLIILVTYTLSGFLIHRNYWRLARQDKKLNAFKISIFYLAIKVAIAVLLFLMLAIPYIGVSGVKLPIMSYPIANIWSGICEMGVTNPNLIVSDANSVSLWLLVILPSLLLMTFIIVLPSYKHSSKARDSMKLPR